MNIKNKCLVSVFAMLGIWGALNADAPKPSDTLTESITVEKMEVGDDPLRVEAKDAPIPTPVMPNTWALMSPFLVLFLLAVGGAYLYFLARKSGGLNLLKKKGNKLRIAETHLLGNRQYLLVVEYESNKILLGVGPGMIEHLCFLNTPYSNAENAEVPLPPEDSKS